MKLAEKLKCPHPTNYDYHCGYQQALIDAELFLDQLMQCGHKRRFVAWDNEGTHYCIACEKEGTDA